MTEDNLPSGQAGMPRWLIIAFTAKAVLVLVITAAIVWYANA